MGAGGEPPEPPLTLATDKVIARIHTVHLMNVEQRQAADDPQTKPPDSGREFACRLYAELASTTTIAIYYYYSAGKLIYRPMVGG